MNKKISFQKLYLIGLMSAQSDNYNKSLSDHHGVNMYDEYLQIGLSFMPAYSIYSKESYQDKLLISIESNRKINNLNGTYKFAEGFTNDEVKQIENWISISKNGNIDPNKIIHSYSEGTKKLIYILDEPISKSFSKSFFKFKKCDTFNLNKKEKNKMNNFIDNWNLNVDTFSNIMFRL